MYNFETRSPADHFFGIPGLIDSSDLSEGHISGLVLYTFTRCNDLFFGCKLGCLVVTDFTCFYVRVVTVISSKGMDKVFCILYMSVMRHRLGLRAARTTHE